MNTGKIDLVVILKYLWPILSLLLGLGGVGMAAPTGMGLYQAGGTGDISQWLIALIGGGGGLLSLLLSSKWFKDLKPPSPAVAMAAVVVAYKFFPLGSPESAQLEAMAAKIGQQMLPLPLPQAPLEPQSGPLVTAGVTRFPLS